tara:strand:- start:806 stop:1303 length:498 start_codon:yes stop_codon:yes gene_type:complete
MERFIIENEIQNVIRQNQETKDLLSELGINEQQDLEDKVAVMKRMIDDYDEVKRTMKSYYQKHFLMNVIEDEPLQQNIKNLPMDIVQNFFDNFLYSDYSVISYGHQDHWERNYLPLIDADMNKMEPLNQKINDLDKLIDTANELVRLHGEGEEKLFELEDELRKF